MLEFYLLKMTSSLFLAYQTYEMNNFSKKGTLLILSSCLTKNVVIYCHFDLNKYQSYKNVALQRAIPNVNSKYPAFFRV